MPFTANRNSSGYGRVRVGGRRVFAHRWAWEKANGEIPAGLCVLHKCDNPACVNVAHLFLGTVSDNHRDMRAKGRQPYPVKLDAEKARWIRARPEGVSAMARALGVSRSTVQSVIRGETWRESAGGVE